MRGSVVVSGEYDPDPDGYSKLFSITTDEPSRYTYFFKRDAYTVELDVNWAAGTLLLADNKVWVVIVGKTYYGYSTYDFPADEDKKVYRVVPCNQVDNDPAVVNSFERGDFALQYPDFKILYQVTSERTE